MTTTRLAVKSNIVRFASTTEKEHHVNKLPGRSLSGAEGNRYRTKSLYRHEVVGRQFAESLSSEWRKDNKQGASQPLAGNQFEARMYDSRVGRWMTKDPGNQYPSPYLRNDPIKLLIDQIQL